MPNLVEIRDLNFAYGDRPILSGLEMDFPRGKVVAVMGGSGGGKTTVLRLIGGQIRPQKAGEGRRRSGAPDGHRRPVPPAPQDGHAVPVRRPVHRPDVFENVAFPLREHTDLPEELMRDLVLMKLHAVGLRNARN